MYEMKRTHKIRDLHSSGHSSYIPEKQYNIQEAVLRVPFIRNDPINLPSTLLNKKVTGLEILDQLQVDLERLLSTCVVRKRYLLNEIKILDGAESSRHDFKEYNNRQSSYNEKQSAKRKNKSKLNTKPKKLQTIVDQPKVTQLRNEHTDKFWSSIEPYCSPLTESDISFLNCLIDEFAKKVDMNIPEIGSHYANDWSDECLNDEQHMARSPKSKTGSNIDVKKNGISSVIDQFSFASKFINNTNEVKMFDFNTNSLKVIDKLKPDHIISNSLSDKAAICMDRRLKKEFIDLRKGYLQDEILEEIKKYQEELNNLQKYHSNELEKFKEVALQNVEKNKIRQQLSVVDNQILKIYRKLKSLKKDAQKEEDELSVRQQMSRIEENLDDRLDYEYEVDESEIMEQYKTEIKTLEEQAKKICEKQKILQEKFDALPDIILR